jgi:hypothetical protein
MMPIVEEHPSTTPIQTIVEAMRRLRDQGYEPHLEHVPAKRLVRITAKPPRVGAPLSPEEYDGLRAVLLALQEIHVDAGMQRPSVEEARRIREKCWGAMKLLDLVLHHAEAHPATFDAAHEEQDGDVDPLAQYDREAAGGGRA